MRKPPSTQRAPLHRTPPPLASGNLVMSPLPDLRLLLRRHFFTSSAAVLSPVVHRVDCFILVSIIQSSSRGRVVPGWVGLNYPSFRSRRFRMTLSSDALSSSSSSVSSRNDREAEKKEEMTATLRRPIRFVVHRTQELHVSRAPCAQCRCASA